MRYVAKKKIMKAFLRNNLLFLLIPINLLSAFFVSAQESPFTEQFPDTTQFQAYCHVSSDLVLPFRLYRSQKADAQLSVPLVVFLHGAGERGDDNYRQLKHCVKYFLDDTITNRYPFLLLVPQCPEGRRWVNTDWNLPAHSMESEPTAELRGVMSVVDSLIGCGAVDSTRVYISGISMGGFGVWDALQRWPERFAAGIAICGGGDPAYSYKMKDLPIFIFHGLKDGVVLPSRSIQMYEALKASGSHDYLLITYPNLYHQCWDQAFSTPGLFQWLFDNQKTKQ